MKPRKRGARNSAEAVRGPDLAGADAAMHRAAERARRTAENGAMTRVDDALLDRMVAVIVEEVDPEQIILFGSRARGGAAASADVDLIVVESAPFDEDRDRDAEETRLWRALASFHVPKDLLLYSRDEVEYWRGSLNHVLARALREGRVLYERR